MKKILINLFTIIPLILFTYTQKASEILIYADYISYDEKKNLIARGNAKIILNNEIILTELAIFNEEKKLFTFPKPFTYKDKNNNYYYGSEGKFDKDLTNAEIQNVKILLNDGSRIVGNNAIKKGDVDIVNKGVYSPCSSKIGYKNFRCPIWQLEGETILHDNKKLMLYQKHSKMKIFNTPVFYLPYFLSPSPLRKKRKSGFLSSSINFNFLDTKISQQISLPYYFNIDIDKELTFTPKFNYGGGVNSSQRFAFDYNQIISGGKLSLDYQMDTELENKNNEKWFKNASLITSYNQNLNEKFHININSALQTSRDYIQTTDQNNKLSYATSLSSSVNVNGYKILTELDSLNVNFTTYQSSDRNEDNKTIPKVLPYLKYNYGTINKNNINYNNSIEYYNIIRELNTNTHSEKQQKISHLNKINTNIYKFKSKISFESEFYNQLFKTTNKKIDNNNFSNNYYRFFPIMALTLESPFKHLKSNILINPKIKVIVASGQSNSNKISNEDSTNNTYNISDIEILNRYSGNDKLDNSKRMIFGLNISRNKINANFFQTYEFTNNSNFHKESGNYNHLSDALSSINYDGEKLDIDYENRYDVEKNKIMRQKITLTNKNSLGIFNISYLDEKIDTNELLDKNQETINYSFVSNKFKKYNTFNLSGSYNASNEKNNEYSLGYKYFDECFGVNLDFTRNDYLNNSIKPSDTLTLTFSFKNLGAYKSTNLAVSEIEKRDIKWDTIDMTNENFN